ncbi:TPA: hypothetical protein N0F65_008345 [Lagenidium giganteum]|uniref:Uncharacterized protein n=1 Tax=Lagenidium giganteum TaxID=4803 RepID=A0AAV2YSY8_9STRA|nr:TPA: hypothetical protein N0F65_008345 [Lagenidium giganteum]
MDLRPRRRQSKWELQTDEDGNFYFVNALTGETTWEMPEENNEGDEDADDLAEDGDGDAGLRRPETVLNEVATPSEPKVYSRFDIAIGVAECMIDMIEKLEQNATPVSTKKKKFVSPAAEARHKKNQVKLDKRKKRLHDNAFAVYLKIIVPPVQTDSAKAADAAEASPRSNADKPRSVGSLFTQEDSDRWTRERDMEKVQKRFGARQARQVHQKHVYDLMFHQHMLKQFRTDLTKHLLSQITYSSDLRKQGVLLMSTPQQLLELEQQRMKKLEPELAEKYIQDREQRKREREEHIDEIFEAADECRVGRLHVLQVLFAIFTHDSVQNCAQKVNGLAALLNSTDLQQFVMGFVSRSRIEEYLVSRSEFHQFVDIIEEVVDHFASVKAAVEDAENEIEATLEAAALAPGTSAVRARLGMVSRRKVEEELALLKETEAQLNLDRAIKIRAALAVQEESYVLPKEEWEKFHHHRFIRLQDTNKFGCCLCRRRKWEIARREQEELESEHRNGWSSLLSRRQKEEEIRLLEKYGIIEPRKAKIPTEPDPSSSQSIFDATSPRDISPSTDIPLQSSAWVAPGVDETIAEVLKYMIGVVERVMDDSRLPKKAPPREHNKIIHRTASLSPHKGKKHSAGEPDAPKSPQEMELESVMKVFESEELERKAMYMEDVTMQLYLERNRRAQERPFLRAQEVAHNAYIRLLEHCASPPPFLYRLQFYRCLAFHPPQRLTVQMYDGAEATTNMFSNHYIVQTIPCRNESEGTYIFKQIKALEEKVRSQFVVKIAAAMKHTFQLFADSGMLVECWPVVFVVQEFYWQGRWIDRFSTSVSQNSYDQVERTVLALCRDLASGLASMHSAGILHLNLKLENIYVGPDDRVRISGLLGFKAGFQEADLLCGRVEDCIDYAIAPPEITERGQITAKADVWMLGCILYHALMLWQRKQLGLEEKAPFTLKAMHAKSVADIMRELPVHANNCVRSLLRMTLQRTASQRPPMTQILTRHVTLKELFHAAQHDDFNAVRDYLQVLLHEQAEPNSPDDVRAVIRSLVEPKTKNTLLHYACDNGNLDACKYFVMCDGMVDIFLNEPNVYGHTPLFYAASSGKLALVKWMISNGADIDTDYSDHQNVSPRDEDQGIFTPLQIACFKGHEDIVNFLVECNAELSGTRRNGKTPLHFASSQNHKAIVRILLEAGADAHACDALGKTPVDVAHSNVLSALLPDQFGPGSDETKDNGLEAIADDDDDDDNFTSEGKIAMDIVRATFGGDVARGLRSKDWKLRVNAVNDANLHFQNETSGKNAAKSFDSACEVIILALNDPISQVVSACCTSLLKGAFNTMMNDKSFHTPQFHKDRPRIEEIVGVLLLRGAGSNEKDASEAITCLLFLVCKSMDITRYLTAKITKIIYSPTQQPNGAENAANGGTAGAVSWRLQLVALKLFNTIASQYRLDHVSSGLNFQDAMKMSTLSLENSSVHVRTAAVDLFVQCLLLRCEQSDMSGSLEEMYEQMKNWSDSIFKQHNQPYKPSIQAKINSGLKNALQNSKRLNVNGASITSPVPQESGRDGGGLQRPKTPGVSAVRSSLNGIESLQQSAMNQPNKSAQKEDDLPYAEPVQEQHKEQATIVQACFGEKITRCLFSYAWAPRVEALSLLQFQVESRQLSFDKVTPVQRTSLLQAVQRTLLLALQDRVNAVFEAGVALLMEFTISFANSSSVDDSFSYQDMFRPLVARLMTKLGDSKTRLHVTSEDALLLLSRQSGTIGPLFVLEEMIACDRNAAHQSLSGVYLTNKLNLIAKLQLEFGVKESADGNGLLPIKQVLQPALQVCEHKDQNVRQVALQIIADAVQMARNAAMPCVDALARGARQKIISKLVERGVLESDLLMEEIDDFEINSEPIRPGTGGGVRPPTASASATKHRPALANTSLTLGPPLSSQSSSSVTMQAPVLPYGTALTSEQRESHKDIIEAFGEELVRCLLDKAWAQREAAVREIERQIACTVNGKNPADKCLPKSVEILRVLSRVLDIGLNDTVARVFQCTLRLFQMATSEFLPLIPDIEDHVEDIMENTVGLVMQKLGDTKQRLRSDCFTLLQSMASFKHIGHALMCRMLVQKYEQYAASTSTLSPLVTGEVIKLLTVLIREASSNTTPGNTAARPDLAAILQLIVPAFENKHVDIRNGAIATYAAIYEATNGGTTYWGGELDLQRVLALAKPATREAITRCVVQVAKNLPSSTAPTDNSNNAPEVDSGRQQAPTLNAGKLATICSDEVTNLLTSSSALQRCLGVEKLIDTFLATPRNPRFKGAWEISCLLAKQLLLDATPAVCLSALDLLFVLVTPPGNAGAATSEFAIPWGEWGVHLILSSTLRSVVQQGGNDSVRVRSQVREALKHIAAKNAAGHNAVCNAILGAPEQKDLSNETSKRTRKVALCKLRWQLLLRLEILLDLIAGHFNNDQAAPNGSDSMARRKSSSSLGSGGSSSGSSRGPGDALTVDNIVPFLGSCINHPSQLNRQTCRKVMDFLKSSRADALTKFLQENCSPSLQKKLQCLLVDDSSEGNNADHFNENDATCVRGSRASHVRRIAALRPPRSVPVEEKNLMVDVFPPPHSAPGKSRRSSGSNGDLGDVDDSMQTHRGDRDDRTDYRRSDEQQLQQVPIWLDQSSSRKSSSTALNSSSVHPVEPEMSNMTVMGGGAVGLVKVRRKSSFRSNNMDESDPLMANTRTPSKYH